MAKDGCCCFVGASEAQVEYLPWGKHDWISRPGLTETKQLLVVRVHMPAGQAHQFHRHPTREEISASGAGSEETSGLSAVSSKPFAGSSGGTSL